MITWHRDGHLLNQRSAVLNSDRHQSLILKSAGSCELTGWVTTAFMRGGTSLEGMGGWQREGASKRGRWVAGMTTLYSYRERMRQGA